MVLLVWETFCTGRPAAFSSHPSITGGLEPEVADEVAPRPRSTCCLPLAFLGAASYSDFCFVHAEEPKIAVECVAKTRIPRHFGLDPVRDIQVLCPMNRGVGAREILASTTPHVSRCG
jgi:hypothetical protein